MQKSDSLLISILKFFVTLVSVFVIFSSVINFSDNSQSTTCVSLFVCLVTKLIDFVDYFTGLILSPRVRKATIVPLIITVILSAASLALITGNVPVWLFQLYVIFTFIDIGWCLIIDVSSICHRLAQL